MISIYNIIILVCLGYISFTQIKDLGWKMWSLLAVVIGTLLFLICTFIPGAKEAMSSEATFTEALFCFNWALMTFIVQVQRKTINAMIDSV